MSLYTQNTREKTKKTLFTALKIKKRGFQRAVSVRSAVTLLLLLVVSLEGALPAASAPLSTPRALGTTETLNVYPAHVLESEWQGYEHVLSADLSADAMYQEFDKNNAAYVSSKVANIAEDRAAAEAVQSRDDAADSSLVPDTSAVTDELDVPLEGDTVDVEVVSDPVEELVPETEEITVPESAPEPVESPEVSRLEPSLWQRVLGIFVAHAQTDEAVVDETSPTDEAVEEADVTEVAPESEVNEVAAEPVVDAASTVEEVLPNDSNANTAESEPVSNSVAVEPTVDEVSGVDSRTLILDDFATAPLAPGQFLRNVQLRASVAGKIETSATGTMPVLTFRALTDGESVTLGSVVVDDEVSNALNGGHFLFAFPSQPDLTFLETMQLEVVFEGDLDMVEDIFIDAVWLELEIETITKEDLMRRANEEVVNALKAPTMYEFASEGRDFMRGENPIFNLRYVSQRSKAVEAVRDFLGRSKIKIEKVAVKHHGSGEIGVVPEVTVTKDGLVSVVLPESERKKLKPGVYEIELTVNEGGERFTDSFEFQWGLLAINTDQTTYRTDDIVSVSAGALTINGNTLCNADLRLYVVAPDGAITQQAVDPSGQCNGNNVVDVPDYSTELVATEEGTYDLFLERVDEDGVVISHTTMSFMVEPDPALVIERTGPTRIFPPSPYPMELTVKTSNGFDGALIERVPNTFKVTAPGATIEDVDGVLEIRWDISILSGHEKTVSYTFDAPDISPFLYELGAASLVSARGGQGNQAAPVEDTASTSASTTPTKVSKKASSVAGEHEVFVEHRQWQIASDAVGQMLLLWDGGAAPTDWTCVSCTSGDPFFQRFVMGSSTGSVTGGAPTHTHTAVGSVLAAADTSTESGSGTIAPSGHTHDYTPTIGSASNLPSYRQLQVIQYSVSAGEPASIPAGAIAIFDAAVPTGWTRYSAQDGYYLRFENTAGTTGGSNTHSHSISGSTDAGSGTPTRTRGGGTVTAALSTHTHAVTGSTAAEAAEPPYIEVILGKIVADGSAPNGMISMWSDEAPSGWLDVSSAPTDPFFGRFIKGSASYGTTGGGATHTHTDVTGLSTTVTANTVANARTGSSGSSAAHVHTVNVTNFSTANNLPPYITAVFGKRQGTDPVFNQYSSRWYVNSNAQTPTDPWPVGATDLVERESISTTTTLVKYGDVVRLRVNAQVTNATSTAGAVVQLQYAAGDVCSAIGSWSTVGASGSSTSLWRGYNNTSVNTGSELTTTLLSSTTVAATYEEDGLATSTPNDIRVDDYAEWDFVLQQNGALAGTQYCFRMVDEAGVPFGTYTHYPTITTNFAPNAPVHETLFDNEKTASTTPYFTFVSTDAEGNDVHYEIQIDNNYDFGSPVVDKNTMSHAVQFTNLEQTADKAPFTSGQLMSFAPTVSFTNGTTYYWRVRAQDPSGSNQWGSWSTTTSFTVDTSLTAAAWYQTTEEQFATNVLVGVETLGSDAVSLISGSTTGTMTGTPIVFTDGVEGTAWDSLVFSDTETTGDVKYTLEYYTDAGAWVAIPDADLSGNAAGFDTSPVSLLGLDTDTYGTLRIVATLTNVGGAPSIQDWAVYWGYRVETPTIDSPFPNEKVSTTTPRLVFTTSDPQSDSLTYQVTWSTDYTFAGASTTRTSDTDAGFENIDTGADTDPFISGDTIAFTLQGADALTNGETYWFKVRAKDTTGDNVYSFWTEPQSFTVDTSVVVSTWFQTTKEQFETNILSGVLATGADEVTVATTASEAMLVYGEGTVTTPRYRRFTGSTWSDEGSLQDIGAPTAWAIVAAGTTREEYVAVTVGTDADVHVQVFQNGEWGDHTELTTTMGDINARGAALTYETVSGDAMVAYCDGDPDPSYSIWNGTSWSSAGTINVGSASNCAWIQLASDPVSDEIIALVRDATGNTYEAQVWNGSAWGNSTTLGTITEPAHEGMALAYEASGNQAIAISSDGNPARFRYNTWNGTTWGTVGTQALGDDFEWGKLVADDGTDQLVLCYQDEDTNIGVVRWTGAAWTGQTELLTTTGKSKVDPGVSCVFETTAGRDTYALAVYTDTTQTNYSVWDTSTWSTGAQINSVGDTITSKLIRTGVGLVLGVLFDETNDSLLGTNWSGSTWSSTVTLEDNASVNASPYGHPYGLVPRNPGREGTTIVSPGIEFTDGVGPYWQDFTWTDSAPGTSEILYRVQYYDGDSWEFISNTDLPGNTAGFTTGPVDLSTLDKDTYHLIRPYAELSCDGSNNCPTLSDWTVRWAEGITVSGTLRAYDQSTAVTSGTVAVAVNGVLQSGKTGTVTGGVWSIGNVTVFPDDVVTVFVSGAADQNEAVGVTRYDGSGDIADFDLYERHVTVGSGDISSTPIANSDIGLYSVVQDEDIFFGFAGGVLQVCATTGCDDAELMVASTTTFQPEGVFYTHDFQNDGTLIATTTLYVSGSWDNNATTTLTGSTVVFSATSTSETIDSTGASAASFGSVTFATTTTSATWSLVSPLTTLGALSLNYGTVSRDGVPITVAGNLSVGASGFISGIGTTTLNGATAASLASQNLTAQNLGNVIIDGTGKVVTLASAILVESITIGADDTLDVSASNYKITTNSNFTNAGTFLARSGTLELSGSGSGEVTTGGDALYTVSAVGTGSYSFSEPAVTISNDVLINGGVLTLASGTTTVAGSFTVNGGSFAHSNATVLFTGSGSETVTLEGTAFTNALYNAYFTGVGTYTFTETNATTSNNVVVSAGTVAFPNGVLSVGGSLLQTAGTITAGTGVVDFTSGLSVALSTVSPLHTVRMSGAGTLTMTSSAVTLTGDLWVDAGTVVLPSTSLTIGGSYANNGVVDPQTGTVNFTSTSGSQTVAFGASALYDVSFASATGEWTMVGSATTTNDFSLASGTWTLGSGESLTVGGEFSNTNGGASTTWTGTTLNLQSGTHYEAAAKTALGDVYDTVHVADGTQVTFWNSALTNAVTDGVSAVYLPDYAATDGLLRIYGAYTKTGGVEYWDIGTDFDGTALGGAARTVTVELADASSVSLVGTTFMVAGSSTAPVAVSALSGSYEVSVTGGTTTATYYAFDDLGLSGVSLLGGAVTSLDDGAYTVVVDGGTALTLASTTIDANPALQIERTTFATTTAIVAYNVTQVDGVPSSYWWFRNGFGNLYGESFDNDDGDPGSVRFDDSSLVLTIAGTVYTDRGVTPQTGAFCDGVTAVIKVVVEDGGTYTGSCAAGTGAYSIPGVVVIGDPTVTVYIDTVAGVDAVLVTKTPTADVLDADLYQNRVIVRHEDVEPLTIADMSAFDSTDDSDVRFVTATSTSGDTLTVQDGTELYVWPSMTFAPNGAVTTVGAGLFTEYDGSLYLATSSVFTAVGTTTYSIGGTFTQGTGATFIPASSTVLMTATTSGQALVSAPLETIQFHTLETVGVGGAWNINGNITLTGDFLVATGTVTGTGDVTLLSGSFFGDGLVSLGGGTTSLYETNTLGGVQSWTFNNLTLGSGSSVGTTTPATAATTTVAGVLTIANAHFYDVSNMPLVLSGTGTVFVETGTFLEGTGTVYYRGSGADVLSTAYYNLVLDAVIGSQTFTATGIGTQVLNDLTVGGAAQSIYTLATNNTVLAVTGDVTIASGGTLTASPSAALTVSGSWKNNGTFIANAGTVQFTPTTSASVAAGASAFAHVIVNGAGALTVTTHATATDSFTLLATSGFTLASGQTLAVGGDFFTAVGGGVTDWTGSTLSLYGAGEQTINAATTSDTYATLQVASGTHVRSWNSSAASVLTATGGSLYSMDHAGVNGDLYVYGDYEKTTGADFWSYSTDFDGATLGGGRQVSVYFESGATAHYFGTAELSVVGSPAAPTTLTNQGTGMYQLTVGGTASTTMRNYLVRNTDTAGLVFTGSAKVHNLSYGDYLVTQNSASAITVGGTVLTASPARTFTENVFATSSGVTGAINVTATGTALSSWRFTNHTGSLAGEQYDVDPDGDPGYIVWDNSAASITVAGRVYSDEGTTVSSVCDGSTLNVHVRVAGLTSYFASCDASTGYYEVNGVTYSPGDSIVAYIDNEAVFAAVVTVDPVSNINNMDLYESRVIVRHENTDPLSIADMAVWDSSDDADIPFTTTIGSPDTLTIPTNTKLIVWDSKNFAPGGDVTLVGGSGAAYNGTLELQANAIYEQAGAEDLSIGGSLLSGSGATFVSGTGTTTFTTTGLGRTIGTNDDALAHVVFSGSGSWTVSDSTFTALSVNQSAGALTLPTGTTTVHGSYVVTGGSFTENGPFVFDGVSTHVLTFNGSTVGALTITSGTYSMSDVNVAVDGGLTVSSGALTLPSGTVSLTGSFTNDGGTVIHNGGAIEITTGTTADVFANGSDLNTVTFAGGGVYTFLDADLALLGDLSLNGGALTLATGTLSIGGSFDVLSGSFAHASGTVLFNSADAGETVAVGGSDFYNVVFASPTGGWTLTESATTSNNFTLTSAASFTLDSGTTLHVGSVFLNTVGGSATTWTGSTLSLAGSQTYEVNTKTQGGDLYETVVVGADGDISFWNSSAITTTVDVSSSVYSQDHGAVDGALAIFGDYHIGTTTEYWDYARDFDGVSLTGSERQVVVMIANGATVTVDGGDLEMLGVHGNETILTNQGSGTYAFRVTDGYYNAQYYQFRNLDSSGLSLSGTPVISSLDYGDFELAVDGGSLISLSSTTLNANASLVILGSRFATTTAIAGYNVALTGVTSNAWTFVDHTGNLSGENFDIDGVTACGSIRFDDSACLLTQQVHYRWRNDDGGIGVPDSEWYDSNWSKRQRVRVKNADAAAYSDVVVKLTIPYDTDMQADFDDLRFTQEDGITTVSFWIERVTASTEAVVWVQVPTLAAKDTTNIFMYYGNAIATSTSNVTATFVAADDFEDGNISEYSGNTSLFTVDSSFAYGGSYGLDNTAHETDKATDGIARFDQVISQGETIRYMQYIDTTAGSGDETCTLFAVQSPVTANQNYAICLEQYNTDRVSIVKNAENTDSTGTLLASTALTYVTGWYEVEVAWGTDDSINVTLSQNGSTVATVSTSDGTYTSGGYGFTYWFNYGGWDSFVVRPLVTTEPTIYFGLEQEGGGATYMSALDTVTANYEVGASARLRLLVENTGLPISGKQYRLEYAPQGSVSSCESVTSGAYNPVPVQASCGSSPVCMLASSQITNGGATTDLLNEAKGTFSAGYVVEDPSNTTPVTAIAQNHYTELEYALVTTANVVDQNLCFRVTDSGTELDTYLRVAKLTLKFDPVISSLNFNNGLPIALLPGTTTRIYATATVTDLNGYTDFATTIATSTMYPTSVTANCTPDDNNCYVSNTTSQCSYTGCSGNSCDLVCYADFYYFAEPTDALGHDWVTFMEVEDAAGGYDFDTSLGIDVLTLRAIDVPALINYGALAASSTSATNNATSTIENLGNVAVDIDVEGTDLYDGYSSTIPVTNQKLATSTFDYTACVTCSVLSTSSVIVDVDLAKPTAPAPAVTDSIYWGIAVPFGVSSAPHTGTVLFTPIGSI